MVASILRGEGGKRDVEREGRREGTVYTIIARIATEPQKDESDCRGSAAIERISHST